MSLEFEGYFPAKDAIWTFCSSCAMSVSVLRIVSLDVVLPSMFVPTPGAYIPGSRLLLREQYVL
jgi:hypothetical protein